MEYIKITDVIFGTFAVIFFFIALFSSRYSKTKAISYYLCALFYLLTGVLDFILSSYGWSIFCIALGLWIYFDDFTQAAKEYLIYGEDEEVEIN